MKFIFQPLGEEKWAVSEKPKFHSIPSPEIRNHVNQERLGVKRIFGFKTIADTKKNKRWRCILRGGDSVSKAKSWA